MVMGPMPSAGFRFNIRYEVMIGLTAFQLGDFQPDTNTMSFIYLNQVHNTLIPCLSSNSLSSLAFVSTWIV